MINKLYIRKNIQKNISSYINIVLIITVSMIIINILNIYIDSVSYGAEISSLTVETSVPAEQILLFNILKVFFAAVGTISICFIYIMFIENKKKDIGILISLGMSNKQLKKLLFFEILVIFVFSYAAALVLSNIFMFALIKNFLLTESRYFVLILYKFSFSSSFFLLIISFISTLAAYLISLSRILRIPVIQTIENNFINQNINRKINIWNKKSAVKYIFKANLMRNKKNFFICSVISVPVIFITLIFFNYMNLLNTPNDESDISVFINYVEMYDYAGIILENIEKLEKSKNISGIESIKYDFYFSDITENPALPTAIFIYAEENADISAISEIEEELCDIFDDINLFNVVNNVKNRETAQRLYQGIIIIANLICSAIFVCLIILLWVFINFYISNQKTQINILKTLGATKKAIIKIAVYEFLTKGLINSLAGIALGTWVSYIVVKMARYDFLINVYLFIFYGLILLITVLSHVLPSFIAVTKILKGEDR